MKIGILTLAAGRSAGGPEIYEINIVRGLAAIDKKNVYHIFHTSSIAEKIFGVSQANFFFHQLKPRSRLISLPLVLPILLVKYELDFYHATYAPAPCAGIPFVFTHHCFSNFKHPEFYPKAIRIRLEPLIKKGIRRSEKTICVSQNVLDLTAEHFNMDSSSFTTIHHGVDSVFSPRGLQTSKQYAAKKFGIKDPYILVVGKLELRKNLQRTLAAFSKFRKHISEPVKLVLVGKRTWHNDSLDTAITELELKDHIIETGYIDQKDLNHLYSAAQIYVFASLWEGFGMPILEAMASGVPVVTSNISAAPEVAGDAAKLVDPYDVNSIVEAMLEVFTNTKLQDVMRQQGIERASQFSWEKAAQETLAVYREVFANLMSETPS